MTNYYFISLQFVVIHIKAAPKTRKLKVKYLQMSLGTNTIIHTYTFI